VATLTELLSLQPLLTLFLVIAVGHALGAIDIKGFSLGVGAVLFAGLFVGAIAPKSQPPALVGSVGLVMFLYGLGVQFGKQFFEGLTGATGRRYNLLMLVALASGAVVAAGAMVWLKVSPAMMSGLFAGTGTSAAAMQAALEAAGNSQPAVGYAVAYPVGLVGGIISMYVMQLIVKPQIGAQMQPGMVPTEIAIRSADVVGRKLGDVIARLPAGVQIVVVRSDNENHHPDPAHLFKADDTVLLHATEPSALAAARTMLGEQVTGRLMIDRSRLDYLRAFVSRPALEGLHVKDVVFPSGVQASITHVQRGDTEILLSDGLTFENGDRVGLLAHRRDFAALQKFFGNSIRGTSEFSYVSLGVGMVLGVALGAIPIPMPVLGTMKLGIPGGVLVVALILGRLRRTWHLTWTLPLAANLTLRNFGLALILAQIGLSSGAPFVESLAANGLTLVFAAIAIVLVMVLIPLLVGHYLMRMPFDDLLGVTSGVVGSPAIEAYAYRAFPSDRVEICYAMIYPASTIVKIAVATLLIATGST
jgi:putative transport protein